MVFHRKHPNLPRVGDKGDPRHDAKVDDGSKRSVEQWIPTRGKAVAEIHVADQKCTEITHVLTV